MVFKSQQRSGLLFFAIGLYIGLRLWGLAGSDLWYDKVFSAVTVSLGWEEMIYAVIDDGVHPPLFYFLLKLWSFANHSVWWLQVFPFLISVLTLIPFYLLCRELSITFLEMSAALLLISVNSFSLEYAHDLRMYGLFQFLALFSLWLFVKLLRSNDGENATLLGLTFVNLLLVFTHYFGWLAVGLEGLYLLIWQRRLFYRYAVYAAGILLCFSTWIWLVLENAATHGASGNLIWLVSPTFSDLAWFYATLNGNLNIRHTTAINLLIFSLPIAVFIWQMFRQRRNDYKWQILVLFAFVPVVFIFVLSILLPSTVWGPRYLIIAAIPYHILLAKSVFASPNKLFRSIFIGLIFSWSLIAGLNNFLQTPKKFQWNEVIEKIKNIDPSPRLPQRIYAFEDWVAVPLTFYVNTSKTTAQVEHRVGLKEIQDRKFVAVFRLPISASSNDLENALREKGCVIAEETIFFDSSQKLVLFQVKDCG